MEYQDRVRKHLGNISRQVGHDVTKKYSYIVTSDDLTNAYLQMRNELNYPLMVDSKNRRAIVYNKSGLEKKIEEVLNECVVSNAIVLQKMFTEDLVNEVVNQLNGITQMSNGSLTKGKSSSSLVLFSNAMVKGLVNGMSKIIDDITKEN